MRKDGSDYYPLAFVPEGEESFQADAMLTREIDAFSLMANLR